MNRAEEIKWCRRIRDSPETMFAIRSNLSTCEATDEKENATSIINSKISFYPVPFSSMTTLDIFANEQTEANISVYNLVGRMIMGKQVSLRAGDNKLPFDFSAYPSGMYLSKIIMDGKVYTIKLTRQEL